MMIARESSYPLTCQKFETPYITFQLSSQLSTSNVNVIFPDSLIILTDETKEDKKCWIISEGKVSYLMS